MKFTLPSIRQSSQEVGASHTVVPDTSDMASTNSSYVPAPISPILQNQFLLFYNQFLLVTVPEPIPPVLQIAVEASATHTVVPDTSDMAVDNDSYLRTVALRRKVPASSRVWG